MQMAQKETQTQEDTDSAVSESRKVLEGFGLNSKVSARHLNFYYGDLQALFDNNLDIAANRVTAIIGPSGCGKSTHLRVYNRIYSMYRDQRAEGRGLAGRRRHPEPQLRQYGAAPQGGHDLSEAHPLPHERL